MSGKKSFTSVEELLSASENGQKPRRRTDAKSPHDAVKKPLNSIEDALAAAEVERQKEKKNFKTFASVMRARSTQESDPTTSAPAGSKDLMDDFDYALEAYQSAKKTMPHDPAGAKVVAVNLLMKEQNMSQSSAQNLVQRAAQYLQT